MAARQTVGGTAMRTLDEVFDFRQTKRRPADAGAWLAAVRGQPAVASGFADQAVRPAYQFLAAAAHPFEFQHAVCHRPCGSCRRLSPALAAAALAGGSARHAAGGLHAVLLRGLATDHCRADGHRPLHLSAVHHAPRRPRSRRADWILANRCAGPRCGGLPSGSRSLC